jgi:hypothetical protein
MGIVNSIVSLKNPRKPELESVIGVKSFWQKTSNFPIID